jgi:hypothetical protein
MGFPVNALHNAVTQAKQEAEAQRRRADRLAARNRRLTLHLAWAITALFGVAGGMLGLGLVLGYAAATGLIGLVR